MYGKSRSRSGYKRKAKRAAVGTLLIFLAAAVIGAFGLAAVWQLLDPGEYNPNIFSTAAGIFSEQQSALENSSASSVPDALSSDSSSGSDSPAAASGLVPEGEWLSSDYFDDALFIGDSITEGITLYAVMDNATVLSGTGINLNTIFTKEIIKQGDGKVSIMEAARNQNPGKIYVLLGVNSMLSGLDSFLADYERVIDTLCEQHPDAVIYVQSIFPVTAAYEKKSGAVTDNEQIREYNAALLAMCEQKGVWYLDVAEAVRDENGALPDSASPSDGIHFGRTYYDKWFDYLRTHGAPNTD